MLSRPSMTNQEKYGCNSPDCKWNGTPAAPDLGEADVWHNGSESFYRARLLKKLTREEALVDPTGESSTPSNANQSLADLVKKMGDAGYCNYAACEEYLQAAYSLGASRVQELKKRLARAHRAGQEDARKQIADMM